ncbi:MAG: hypothetical protein ACT4PT_13210 [Methanobacteriota archaeon]
MPEEPPVERSRKEAAEARDEGIALHDPALWDLSARLADLSDSLKKRGKTFESTGVDAWRE